MGEEVFAYDDVVVLTKWLTLLGLGMEQYERMSAVWLMSVWNSWWCVGIVVWMGKEWMVYCQARMRRCGMTLFWCGWVGCGGAKVLRYL